MRNRLNHETQKKNTPANVERCFITEQRTAGEPEPYGRDPTWTRHKGQIQYAPSPTLRPSCAINTNIKRNLLLPFPQLAAFFVCVCTFFFLFALGWCSGATYPPPLPSLPTPPLNDKCSPDCRSVQIESRMNEGGGAAQTVGRPPPQALPVANGHVAAPPPANTHTHTHTSIITVSHVALLIGCHHLFSFSFIHLFIYLFIFTCSFCCPRPLTTPKKGALACILFCFC